MHVEASMTTDEARPLTTVVKYSPTLGRAVGKIESLWKMTSSSYVMTRTQLQLWPAGVVKHLSGARNYFIITEVAPNI